MARPWYSRLWELWECVPPERMARWFRRAPWLVDTVDILLTRGLPRLAVCWWAGHLPVDDLCRRPAHRHCVRCDAPTPYMRVRL
jgi:hypothetical protein